MTNERDRYARMIEEVRRARPTRRQILKGGLAAGTLLAASTVPMIGMAQTPKRGGIMRVAFVGTPSKLDIHQMTGVEEVAIGRNVYDSLVFTDDLLTPRPELATALGGLSRRNGLDVPAAQGRQVPPRPRDRCRRRRVQLHSHPQPRNRVACAFGVFAWSTASRRSTAARCGSPSSRPFAEFPQLVGGSFQAKIAPRDVTDLNKTPDRHRPVQADRVRARATTSR